MYKIRVLTMDHDTENGAAITVGRPESWIGAFDKAQGNQAYDKIVSFADALAEKLRVGKDNSDYLIVFVRPLAGSYATHPYVDIRLTFGSDLVSHVETKPREIIWPFDIRSTIGSVTFQTGKQVFSRDELVEHAAKLFSGHADLDQTIKLCNGDAVCPISCRNLNWQQTTYIPQEEFQKA